MPRGDRLFDLLRGCDAAHLARLWTVDLKMGASKHEFDSADAPEQHLLISAELRSAAGHTLENMRRTPHELPWADVLSFVTVALAASVQDGTPLLDRAAAAGDDSGRERVLLSLAETLCREGAQHAGLPADPAEADDLDHRAGVEDRLLRSVSPETAAIKELRGGSRALRLAVGFIGGGYSLPALAMRPSYSKVVPATVRLLHLNRVAPLDP